MKLTDVQRTILHAVALQADKSAVEIAKLLGMRAHIVRRTITNLLDRGVFIRRSVWIDPHALGLTVYIVHLMLPPKATSYRRQFLEHLVSTEEACTVSELGGDGVFEMHIWARDRGHLDDVLEKLAASISFPFRLHSCSIVLETEYSGTSDRELPRGIGGSLHFGPLKQGDRRYPLDQKDHEILSALANHNYLNLHTVARALSMAPPTLQYRIEKLETAGIIKGHYYVMDPKVLNETPICLQVKSRVLSQKDRSALRKFCNSHPRIGFITFLLGPHAFEIYTLVPKQELAHAIISDLSARFGDMLESIHMTPQISFAKHTLYPFKKLTSLVPAQQMDRGEKGYASFTPRR